MITRNIAKNTATQVNSDKIGVLVHPDEITPASQDVLGITVDYSNDVIVVTSTAEIEVSEGVEETRQLAAVNDDEVYYYDGTEIVLHFEEEGEEYDVTFQKWIRFSGEGPTELWGNENDEFSIINTTDPQNPVYVDYYGDFSRLSVNDSFLQINTNEWKKGTGILDPSYRVEGDFIINSAPDMHMIVGYVAEKYTLNEELYFEANFQDGNWYRWNNEDYVDDLGKLRLFTEGRKDNVKVGDQAYISKNYFNPQSITEVDVNIIPPVYDDINCTVSYSVDGKTWTEHPTALTDDNNVICNIPRYMYLKFSQDVEITEP